MAVVLLVRPDPAATAARLRAAGHEAVVAPMLRRVPVPTPRPAGPFDAVLVTSAAVFGSPLDVAGLTALPFFTVGDRSADAARAAGFKRVASAAGNGRALAALVCGAMPSGGRLLHLAGRDRSAEPAASLRRAGFPVTLWTVYAMEPVPLLPGAARDALADGRVEVALHFSRRSAAALLDGAERDGLVPRLAALRHLCLSDAVASALDRLGPGAAVAVAARPDEDALLAAI